MPAETIELVASDGYRLAADLALPAGEPHTAVLLAPAMAVPRRLYRAFMDHLATQGFAVLVLDYRGIGGSAPPSLRGFKASLLDWARLDLQAGLDLLKARFPSVPTVWFGHSVGGQLLGLLKADNGPPVERALLVAAQSGYWRNWGMPASFGMFSLWHAMPAVTAMAGCLPMRMLGQGLDVPAGVANQWADWGRDPRYIGKAAVELQDAAFHHLAVPVRAVSVTDDAYAPAASIPPLLALYTRTAPEIVSLAPGDVGLPVIGHFGAFKRPEIWRAWAGFLGGRPLAGGA